MLVDLAPFEREDVSQIVRGMQKYSNLKWLSLRDAQTLGSEQVWYDRVSNAPDEVVFGVWRGDDLIGCFSLMNIVDRRATAGAVLYSNDAQEMGIGSAVTRAGLHYAVHVLDLMAIDSEALSVNERSLRMQESVGFVGTGSRLQAAVVDGQLCNSISLLWVNPSEYVWDYFWRGRIITDAFKSARTKAELALGWADEHVAYL
jgi:RimJ/RimL family protein N-acetyltransferase